MTTNVLLLQQLTPPVGGFVLPTNSDWLSQFYFGVPGSAPSFVQSCGITSGSNTVTTASTLPMDPGMPIVQMPGIPAGAFVGNVSSLTQFPMVNSVGSPLNATQTNLSAQLLFLPVPLDLTGIKFIANLRALPNGAQVFLTAQTDAGTMTNGLTNGTLSFNVPEETIEALPPGSYFMDLVAIADGHVVNLFAAAPVPVTIVSGITDPDLLT